MPPEPEARERRSQLMEFGAVGIPPGRIGEPEEKTANAALFLAPDAASCVTGAVLCDDGGDMAQCEVGEQ